MGELNTNSLNVISMFKNRLIKVVRLGGQVYTAEIYTRETRKRTKEIIYGIYLEIYSVEIWNYMNIRGEIFPNPVPPINYNGVR